MDPTTAILIAVAFFASALSGVIGMGGGMLLLSAMAASFPPAVLIPLHGTIQFASNGVRAALGWREISPRIVLPMAAGCVVGACLGSQLAIALPEAGYQIAMGAFILISTWMPRWKHAPRVRGKFFLLGAVSTTLSFIMGATGPMLAPFFLDEDLKREAIIATKAAGQAVTHLLKLSVFSALGFQLLDHWPILCGMLAAVAVGTVCGRFLLDRISERVFVLLFKVAITILSVRMLLQGIAAA